MAGQNQKIGGNKEDKVKSDTPTLQPGETKSNRLVRNLGRAGSLIYDVIVDEVNPVKTKIREQGTEFRAAIASEKERRKAAEEAERKFNEAKEELEGYKNLREELNAYKKKVEELIAIREGEKAGYEVRIAEIAYDTEQAKTRYERLFEAKTELLKTKYDEITGRLNLLQLSQNTVVDGFEKLTHRVEVYEKAMEDTAQGIVRDHSSVVEQVNNTHQEVSILRNSLTPAPKEGATDQVDSIDAKPPPLPSPLEAGEADGVPDLSGEVSWDEEETGEFDISSKNSIPPEAVMDDEGFRVLVNQNSEKLKEQKEAIAALKEEIETACNIGEPADVDKLEASLYAGYEQLAVAHQKTLKYLCKKRNEARANAAMLEVLYNATNSLLELEGLPVLAEVGETKKIALEKEQAKLDNAVAVMLKKKSAKNIAEELERQDEMISAIRAGLDEFYRKYEVGG